MTGKQDRRTALGSLAPWVVLAVLAVVMVVGMVWARTALAPAPRVEEDGIARVSVQQAKRMVDRGQAVLVDARSEASYHTKHIEGALSLPADLVPAQAATLPETGALIFYCT